MSQTIYKTDINILTILKVDDNCNDQKRIEDESNRIIVDNSQGINQDQNINQEIEKINRKSISSVTWDESVIDNEMMNKKKSKKCCIFHKKRNFGESSSSDSDSDINSDDNKSNQNTDNYKNKKNQCNCNT